MLTSNERAEKYGRFETYFLTDREAECVELAASGMRQTEIAKTLGLSRQRVSKALKQAEGKQYVCES